MKTPKGSMQPIRTVPLVPVRPSAASLAGAPLSEAQLTEIRRRVLAGAYDSIEVIDAVARRILERGDL
jgi:hypothetical protein